MNKDMPETTRRYEINEEPDMPVDPADYDWP